MTEGLYALAGVAPILDEANPPWIAPGARVIGKVRIAAGASIWFNAVIRGDNEWIEVGEGSNVQEGAVLHTDPGFTLSIGKDCTIGHNAIVHGCVLGDGVLVGMGATVMNGAKVGAGSLIGANALLPEGKVYPERSLILGAPAKAVKELSEAQAAQVKAAAASYRQRAESFRTEMTPV